MKVILQVSARDMGDQNESQEPGNDHQCEQVIPEPPGEEGFEDQCGTQQKEALHGQ